MTENEDSGLRRIVESVDLLNVYPLSMSGSRTSGREATQFEFVLHPQWKRSEEQLDYRFDLRCEPKDADGEIVATINYSVVCAFEVLNPLALEETNADDLSSFGSSIAIYAAYPYLREGVQSIAARLGMSGISLGLLRRGHDLPSGMSFGDLTAYDGDN